MMNARERQKCTLNHQEADRVPIHDSPWESTIDRWRKEGLSQDIPVSDYFGYEMAWFFPDFGPQLGCEVLEENEEYIIQRNRFGEVVKNHRDLSTTPQVIDSPIKNKKDWEKIKTRFTLNDSRLVFSSNIMVPTNYISLEKSLSSFRQEWEKGRFITYGVLLGYDLLQRYLGSESTPYSYYY